MVESMGFQSAARKPVASTPSERPILVDMTPSAAGCTARELR
jgi:hypothetical protein